MKGFLSKVQQKKGAPNAADGKPAGGESNVRVDISLPKTQRRYYASKRFRTQHDLSILHFFCDMVLGSE